MCGIIGYLGKDDALPILMGGLRNLEYRGYDSAGIVVTDKSRAYLAKAVGKVDALEKKLIAQPDGFIGNNGIAHVRWATHGGVTEENAHPHSDCEGNIFVVHNGIIENYKELKEILVREGHRFISETDSEVLPHLIEDATKGGNVSLEEAVRRVLVRVRGTYGVVILDIREPEKLIAARNFSPLTLGVGDGELIIASDVAPIMKLTRNVVYLNNGEFVVMQPQGHRIFTIQNQIVHREATKLDWDTVLTSKESHPHFMLKEIFEEPEAIRNSIRGRLIVEEGRAKLGGLEGVEEKLRNVKRLFIAACGSAYFAGKVGEYMLEEHAGIPVEVDIASEFRYRKQLLDAEGVLLAISQSGETADTLGALYEAKEKGVLTLGIVNTVGSTISRETDGGVYNHAGPEIGVASTKVFVSQVSVLALLALFFGRKRGLSLAEGKRIATELQKIPELMERVLESQGLIEKIAKKYQSFKNFFFLGRKYNFPIALEGALKLKEISYVHAEAYSGGEMKHGPIALIDKQFPSLVIVPHDSVYEKMISNIQEIKARGGPVIAIGTEGDERLAKIADDVFYIPKTIEMLTPLLSVVPLHLFAYNLGVLRGVDVDKPRNLAKSVTVE